MPPDLLLATILLLISAAIVGRMIWNATAPSRRIAQRLNADWWG